MSLSKRETLEIIESKLRKAWPYDRFGKYSEPIIEEILEDVKECLFSPRSEVSLIGYSDFRLLDLDNYLIYITIAWSRINLPKDKFKENVKVAIVDSHHLYNTGKKVIETPQIISKDVGLSRELSLSLLKLSNGTFYDVNDVEHWLYNRKAYSRYSDIFYEIHLDPACLLDRDISFVAVNRIIPAIVLKHSSVYYVLYDNREDNVFAYYKGEKQTIRYMEEFLKKFPVMTKKDLKSFLVASVLRGFMKRTSNPFKKSFLVTY